MWPYVGISNHGGRKENERFLTDHRLLEFEVCIKVNKIKSVLCYVYN